MTKGWPKGRPFAVEKRNSPARGSQSVAKRNARLKAPQTGRFLAQSSSRAA
jgi:hypothetical protein